MTCFTPLEHALLLDSGAVKADDGTQFAVCPSAPAMSTNTKHVHLLELSV
jgi:hypothetical protein